jgi:hypothetical protein
MHLVVAEPCGDAPVSEYVKPATDTKGIQIEGIAHEPSDFAVVFNDCGMRSEDENCLLHLASKIMANLISLSLT